MSTKDDTMHDRSVEDLIRETFNRCDDCGRLLSADVRYHDCPSTNKGDRLTRTVPARRREHRQVRREADFLPRDDWVISVARVQRQCAYHELTEDVETGEMMPACNSNTSHDPSDYKALKRGDALDKNRFPCRLCFPEVAERAVEIWEERYGPVEDIPAKDEPSIAHDEKANRDLITND